MPKKLNHFSLFLRYPAQAETEPLVFLLDQVTELFSIYQVAKTSGGFYTPKQVEKGFFLLGKEKELWLKKSEEMLLKIQQEEFLPLMQDALNGAKMLLEFAKSIRQ